MKQLFVTAVLSAVVLQAASACAGPSNAQTRVNADAKVLTDFKERVKAYVDLRNKADDGAPRLKQTEDPAEIRTAQTALATRLMVARAGAKRGDIFTPEITLRFRQLLRPEVNNPDTKQLIQEDNPGNIKFKVNGPYPDAEPLSTVPPNVLASLPALPADLEYRFVGKHMILRDSRANIVIDYIANAIG